MKNFYNHDLVPGQIYFSEFGNLYLILKIVIKPTENSCDVHVLRSFKSNKSNKNFVEVVPSLNKTPFIRSSIQQV